MSNDFAAVITDEQISALNEVTRDIRDDLDEADGDFDTRRQLLEYLKVGVRFSVENEEKVLYIYSVPGMDEFAIVSSRYRSAHRHCARI